MITFSQTSGNYHFEKGSEVIFLGTGWAGNNEGKNNHSMQNVSCVGPLPCGVYKIVEPIKHPRLCGFAMQLLPSSENEMFGRSDFWIHGPSLNAARYGLESMGCSIADRTLREAIWKYSNNGEEAFVVTP